MIVTSLMDDPFKFQIIKNRNLIKARLFIPGLDLNDEADDDLHASDDRHTSRRFNFESG